MHRRALLIATGLLVSAVAVGGVNLPWPGSRYTADSSTSARKCRHRPAGTRRPRSHRLTS